MSDGDGHPHPKGGQSNRKRGRKKRNKASRSERKRQNEIEAMAPYRGVSFCVRPSSGRPGTPHRYFESSYDAHFDFDGGGDLGDSRGPKPSDPASTTDPGDVSMESHGDPPGDPDDGAEAAKFGGRQVVHRHLNGLCIVTAGDVLENVKGGGNRGDGGGGDAEDDCEIGVASVEYLVRPGEDAQSARGKIRSMNKRHKRSVDGAGSGGGKGDGSVAPRDPLCRIAMSDGTEVTLRCCVSGTVIELNSRLLSSGDAAEETGLQVDEGVENDNDDEDNDDDDDANNEGDSSEGGSIVSETVLRGSNPSLVLRDPLLDGHLAVIMPAWGAFPPREQGQQENSAGQLG